MTKYTATLKFGSDAELAEVQEWFDKLTTGFPGEVEASLKMEPMVLNVEDVTDAHAGNVVKFYSKRYGAVKGTLEHVYLSPDGAARILVIDGVAYHLTFEVITLSEW